MPWRKRIIWFGVGLLIALILTAWSVFDTINQTIQHQLAEVGKSIYEHHRLTGQWPKGVDDLAKTSLPPHVIEGIKQGYVVVAWHQDLKPDPKDNAGRVLAYHSGGTLQFGRVWTCWGDLRIEYESRDDVEAKLGKN